MKTEDIAHAMQEAQEQCLEDIKMSGSLMLEFNK